MDPTQDEGCEDTDELVRRCLETQRAVIDRLEVTRRWWLDRPSNGVRLGDAVDAAMQLRASIADIRPLLQPTTGRLGSRTRRARDREEHVRRAVERIVADHERVVQEITPLTHAVAADVPMLREAVPLVREVVADLRSSTEAIEAIEAVEAIEHLGAQHRAGAVGDDVADPARLCAVFRWRAVEALQNIRKVGIASDVLHAGAQEVAAAGERVRSVLAAPRHHGRRGRSSLPGDIAPAVDELDDAYEATITALALVSSEQRHSTWALTENLDHLVAIHDRVRRHEDASGRSNGS